MDQQQLLATLIQLSDEQQHRIAELLSRLEGQAQTLTRASQQAEHAASAIDRNGQKTALHLQGVDQAVVSPAAISITAGRAGCSYRDRTDHTG